MTTRSNTARNVSASAPAIAASRRSTRLLPGGLYHFADTLTPAMPVPATIITCTAWLLEVYSLDAGDLFFLSGAAQVRATSRRFGAVFPPFSVARLCLDRVAGHVLGFAGTKALPPAFAGTPTLFEIPHRAHPELPPDIFDCATALRAIPAWPHASALSYRAKNIIDQSYLTPISLAGVAAQLGVTAAHLSRQFKRDFGLAPSAYLHQLRLADAPLKLARGEEIAAISHDVGYRDLSRFYKQFRKATRTSPGACRTIMAPHEPDPPHS